VTPRWTERPATWADVESLELLPLHAPCDPRPLLRLAMTPDELDVAMGLTAITLLWDDVPIAVGGYVHHWPGRMAVWTLPTEAAIVHRKTYYRSVRDGIRRMIARYHPIRIEATSRCDDPISCDWLEAHQFDIESVMKRYGPDGSDHFMYVRLV